LRSVHGPHLWCGRASQEVFVELEFIWQATGHQGDESFGLTGTPEVQNEPRCAKVGRQSRPERTMNTPRRRNVLMLYPLFVAESFWSFAESCNLMGVRRPAAPWA